MRWLSIVLVMMLLIACKPVGSAAVDIGQQGHIVNANGSDEPLARTSDDLKTVFQHREMIPTLVAAKRLYSVPNGSRVLVTDGDWLSPEIHVSQVTILDGPQAGTSGWMFSVSLAP